LNLKNPKSECRISETLMAATMNAFGVAKAVRLARLNEEATLKFHLYLSHR
jgi:hypothetical protein